MIFWVSTKSTGSGAYQFWVENIFKLFLFFSKMTQIKWNQIKKVDLEKSTITTMKDSFIGVKEL